MKIELDKTDLINLVNGVVPGYDLFDNPTVKKCGRYNASYGTWSWNSELDNLSEVELYDLYKLCKK